MMSMRNRIVALCVTVALVMTLIPVFSMAESSDRSSWPTLHIFGPRSTNSVEDYNTMQLIKDWSEAVQVNLEWELVATGYEDKLSLKLASGDLPDVILRVTDAELIKYADEGVFLPLEDYIAEYAPNLTKAWEEAPASKQYNTAPDGHIYSFPYFAPTPWSGINRVMAINISWLEKLGLQMPTTLAELKDVLIAFRDQDPNGNGQKDEIPLSWAGSLSGYHPMGWAFGGDWLSGSFNVQLPSGNTYVDVNDEGKVYFVGATEEYKNYLRWYGELFAEGLIDPTVFTQGTDQYAAKLNQDPYVVGVASVWDIGDSFVTSAAYDYYDYLPPLKGLNGEDPVQYFNQGTGNRGRWIVTTACKDPALAVRVADYLMNEEIGVQMFEGPFDVRLVECTQCNDGVSRMAGPAPEGMDNTTFRDTVAPGFGSSFPSYQSLNAIKKWLHLHYTDRKVAFIDKYLRAEDGYQDPSPMPGYFMTAEESETYSSYWTDIVTYVHRVSAEMVMNNNVDEVWDQYLKELKSMHLDDAIGALQSAVNRSLEVK
ncbi:MAG: extracellular solute-binding protein [Clostridia bacterium]|nr:extracellular solute-binding protein [Clostridia bacterium]